MRRDRLKSPATTTLLYIFPVSVLHIRSLIQVPAHKAFTYDKGAKALRVLLPNGNHLYMPCFLAPSQGKTTFTGEEATANKAIARCRYVVEITYTRVKDWKILAGEIPRENFHLMNSAWWWALGHGNMCRGMLVAAPGEVTGVPPLYHYGAWKKNH